MDDAARESGSQLQPAKVAARCRLYEYNNNGDVDSEPVSMHPESHDWHHLQAEHGGNLDLRLCIDDLNSYPFNKHLLQIRRLVYFEALDDLRLLSHKVKEQEELCKVLEKRQGIWPSSPTDSYDPVFTPPPSLRMMGDDFGDSNMMIDLTHDDMSLTSTEVGYNFIAVGEDQPMPAAEQPLMEETDFAKELAALACRLIRPAFRDSPALFRRARLCSPISSCMARTCLQTSSSSRKRERQKSHCATRLPSHYCETSA